MIHILIIEVSQLVFENQKDLFQIHVCYEKSLAQLVG